jgi:hypothetical protein
MKLHLFNDNTACLDGTQTANIECDKSGVLTIGANTVKIVSGEVVKLPSLTDGILPIKFTDKDGNVYIGPKTRIKNGRIFHIPTMTQSEITLKHQYDAIDARVIKLEREYEHDALGFLRSNETEEFKK